MSPGHATICGLAEHAHIDVVKVRLMTDKHRQLNGVIHGVKTILVNEGFMAFYKGFGMCWARVCTHSYRGVKWLINALLQLGTHTIVSFLIFERLRKWFGVDPL